MNYGWIVDEDHLSGPKAEHPDETLDGTGVMGPQDIEEDLQARLKAGEGVKFRLLDDDGDLYYTGRLVRREGEDFELREYPDYKYPLVACTGEEHEWFGPLWDYGTPNAGAVTILLQKDNKWGLL